MSTKTGTVRWFDAKKGYGFIDVAGDPNAYFVHFSQIGGKGYKTLNAGDRVDFTPHNDHKGWKATNVTVLQRVGTPVGIPGY